MAFWVRVLRMRQVPVAALLMVTLCSCVGGGNVSPTAPEPPGPPAQEPPVVAVPPSIAPAVTSTVQKPFDLKFLPSDESRKLGLEYFNRGDYGTAERYFRNAVEKAPGDSNAWVGLAASYDRIGRFDLADRAYKSAIKLVGETTEILNNLGYSYMLRGQYVTARQYIMKAYARDPNDPTIANNLLMLEQFVPPTTR